MRLSGPFLEPNTIPSYRTDPALFVILFGIDHYGCVAVVMFLISTDEAKYRLGETSCFQNNCDWCVENSRYVIKEPSVAEDRARR